MKMSELKSIVINVDISKRNEFFVSAMYGTGGAMWILQTIEPGWIETLKRKWDLKGKTAYKVEYGFFGEKYNDWYSLWNGVKKWIDDSKIKVDPSKCIPEYLIFVGQHGILVEDRRPSQLMPSRVIDTNEIQKFSEQLRKLEPTKAVFEVFQFNELVTADDAIELVKNEYERALQTKKK